jgi:hypothetical protein
LFYHCAKRIFNRQEHGCLSGADKPKAIEVLLKFTRLYDHTDFAHITSTFTESTYLDYGITPNIDEETKQTIVWAINESPSGFRVPNIKIIERVIKQIEV